MCHTFRMDSSDAIRKTQAKAVYSYYRNTVLVNQPNCNYSTCSSITGCVTNYPNYEVRQQVTVGSQVCNSCASTGCGCK